MLPEKPEDWFQCKVLPTHNGEIDWDTVCHHYHDYILSPFAPEMVRGYETGCTRNLLLNYLLTIPEAELKQSRVLDLGCGPGNLIPFVADKVGSLSAIDASRHAIRVATEKATEFAGLDFNALCVDMLLLDDAQGFDIVISSNSILPASREAVLHQFNKIRGLLRPGGLFLAILPSFDTTLYLRELWLEQYCGQNTDDKERCRLERHFNKAKCVDEDALAFADDGCHVQCYHTFNSIMQELSLASLKPLSKPTKLYYPWELCKRFDYGYFPQASEEIWDWFVVAEAVGAYTSLSV